MICEAGMLESCSYEGPQRATDIRYFLDGFESAILEDVTRFGDLPVLRKDPSSGATGSSTSPNWWINS